MLPPSGNAMIVIRIRHAIQKGSDTDMAVYWGEKRYHSCLFYTSWGITALLGETRKIKFLGLLLGLVVLYAFGTAWFLLLSTRDQGHMGILPILGWCVFPFVIPDLVKLGLALALERRLGKSLSLQ